LTHDSFSRLTQVSKTGTNGVPVENYKYDDSGRRIQKTVGSTSTNFLYDGPDIVNQYDNNWMSPLASYTHGPGTDDPIMRVAGGTTQFYHQDGIGSVVGVTNQSGVTDGTVRYDAWGNKIPLTGTIPQYGYTGREPDDTGLVYYRARYYDPSIGRFTQKDPIGMNGGLNLYAYVRGNPVNFNDPLGLSPNNPTNSVSVGTGGDVQVNEASYASTTPQGQTAGYQSLGGTQVVKNASTGNPALAAQTSQGDTQGGQVPSDGTADSSSVLQQVGNVATKIGTTALDLIGKAWALPNTAVGLVLGVASLPFGGKISFGNNAIQFTSVPFLRNDSAVTLGNVILYDRALPPDSSTPRYDRTAFVNVGLHEQAHTYQYQVLGPLFVPAWALFGGPQASNPFERAADDFAQGTKGWWP
jgi:RHS repeat-associated protein